MITFIRNVQSWQSRNPEAIAAQPVKPSDSGSSLPFVIGTGGGITIAFAIFAALLFKRKRHLRHSRPDHVALKESPDTVKSMLAQILKYRDQIQSPTARDFITAICNDTESYFRRNTKRGETLRNDADVFVRHLSSVKEVLRVYVDVQNDNRYYEDPKQLMERGEDALNGFAQFVLENVRRSNRDSLTNYRVDAKILDAQRYS
jgi:hypothetical protein